MPKVLILPVVDAHTEELPLGGKRITLPAMASLVQEVLDDRARLKDSGECDDPAVQVDSTNGSQDITLLVRQAIITQLREKQPAEVADFNFLQVGTSGWAMVATGAMSATPVELLARRTQALPGEFYVLVVPDVATGIQLAQAFGLEATEASFAEGYGSWAT